MEKHQGKRVTVRVVTPVVAPPLIGVGKVQAAGSGTDEAADAVPCGIGQGFLSQFQRGKPREGPAGYTQFVSPTQEGAYLGADPFAVHGPYPQRVTFQERVFVQVLPRIGAGGGDKRKKQPGIK